MWFHAPFRADEWLMYRYHGALDVIRCLEHAPLPLHSQKIVPPPLLCVSAFLLLAHKVTLSHMA